MRARRTRCMPWPVLLLLVVGGIVVPAAPAAALGPTNLEPPSLGREGRTLTTTTGSWFLYSGPYAYNWESCDAGDANCFTVPGRTINRYLLTTADVGRRIRSVVFATNLLGTTAARSATQAVAASPPSNLTPPTVTASGSTLSSTLGAWSDPSPESVTYTRRWQRCPQADGLNCQDVAGQSGVSFALTTADELRFIRVVVSAEGLGRASVASALFGPIPAAPTPGGPGGPGSGDPGGGPKDPTPAQPKPRKLRPFPRVIIAGRLIRGRTLVSGLVVRAGPKGSTVTVTCRGRGCPRGTFRARLNRAGTLQLKRFQRMYGSGAVIEIRITSPGAIGKFTRVQIRPRGVPSRRDACLMPGKSKPTRCP